jgi:Flp pilus assembly protein TadD
MSGSRNRNKAPKSKPPDQARDKNPVWAGILLILVITFIAYIPATKAGYIWDDDDHFTENELMNDWEGFKKIWSSSSAVYYPLVLTSFWIMRRLWGLIPLPYHLVNIFLHSLNAMLFWMLLKRLKVRGAWFAGALFALHPVHVESVAWVTELKNTQSALLYLLSLLSFHKFYLLKLDETIEDKGRNGKRAWYFLCLLFFLLALLSKPSTVMLPAVLALFIFWREGKIRFKHLLPTIPFFLLSLASSGWTVWEQKFHSGARGAEWSLTFLERLLVAGRIVWFYLGKIIFPYPLIFIYPRWEVNASSFLWYLPLAGIIIAFGMFFRNIKTWGRSMIFCFGYFLILLFPVLGFFNIYFMRFSYVGDHFQYLASMGPLALVSATVVTLAGKSKGDGKHVRIFLCSLILAVFGVLAWRQARIYKNVETLWKDTIKQNPNAWIAWHNLGFHMMNQDRNREAMVYYRNAVRLKPDYWEAFFNMGLILAEDGNPDQAIECFQKALDLNPLEVKIHSDLALALSKVGRFEDALKEIDYYLKLEPNDPFGFYNKATVLSEMGSYEDAIVWYNKAIDLNPELYQAYSDLGNVFYRIGEVDKAAIQFQKALSINPDDEVARANLNLIREEK